MDASNQRTEYTYDPYGRLAEVRHYSNWDGREFSDQRWNYYYDANPFYANYTQNGWGRLAAVEFGSAPNGSDSGVTQGVTQGQTGRNLIA